MNKDLAKVFAERIRAGLNRYGITTVSKWSEMYRIMGAPRPGPWNTEYYPWLKDILNNRDPMSVSQKSAQMGFTEAALNAIFKRMDIDGVSCLYVLPASIPDAKDFSSRVDAAIEMSPHLTKMFTDVRNIGLKRAGSASLYIRGSRSRSQLKSIPVGYVVLDELDEFEQKNIPMIFERMSGQVTKQAMLLSTPTIPEHGINVYYGKSTQNLFTFPCPHCSRMTYLAFPECLVITAKDMHDPNIVNSHLICKECKARLDHETKHIWLKDGIWVPQYPNNSFQGYSINQLYSSVVAPYEIASKYFEAQTSPADEQEFYNSKLGSVHIVKGSNVDDNNIRSCQRDGYMKMDQAPNGAVVTMGIDIGKWIHYEIDQWILDESARVPDINRRSIAKLLTEGVVGEFEDLDVLMQRYNVGFAVVDMNPERRKAMEFAMKWYGRVKCCYYLKGINVKSIKEHSEEEQSIAVDRTSWLDVSLGRFRNKKIILPADLSEEYKLHIKAQVRVYNRDEAGNPTASYMTGTNKPDHFGHARNYAEIALPLLAGIGSNQNIQSPLNVRG